MKNYAYVSLLATDNYIGAAIVLMECWRELKSPYPFYMMVTENISQEKIEILEVLGFKIIHIDEWQPTEYVNMKESLKDDKEAMHWHGTNPLSNGWQHIFSKLLIWNLTQFDKVCWVDLDIIFFRNIDDVFDLPGSTFLEPDANDYVSSQLIVAEPNEHLFKALKEYGDKFIPTEETHHSIFTDEDIIHSFFHDEIANCKKFIPITYSYAWNRCSIALEFMQLSHQLHGVHITGPAKPWLLGNDYIRNFSSQWYPAKAIWNYYVSCYNVGVKKLMAKGFKNLTLWPEGDEYDNKI